MKYTEEIVTKSGITLKAKIHSIHNGIKIYECSGENVKGYIAKMGNLQGPLCTTTSTAFVTVSNIYFNRQKVYGS